MVRDWLASCARIAHLGMPAVAASPVGAGTAGAALPCGRLVADPGCAPPRPSWNCATPGPNGADATVVRCWWASCPARFRGRVLPVPRADRSQVSAAVAGSRQRKGRLRPSGLPGGRRPAASASGRAAVCAEPPLILRIASGAPRQYDISQLPPARPCCIRRRLVWRAGSAGFKPGRCRACGARLRRSGRCEETPTLEPAAARRLSGSSQAGCPRRCLPGGGDALESGSPVAAAGAVHTACAAVLTRNRRGRRLRHQPSLPAPWKPVSFIYTCTPSTP